MLQRASVGNAKLLLPAVGWAWLLGLVVAGLLQVPVRRHHFESAGLAFGIGLLALTYLQPGSRGLAVRTTVRAPILVYIVPFIVAFLAFGWSLTVGPLSDDFVLHRWAVAGQWVPDTWPYLRPLPLAVWQAVEWASGGWVALHLLNTVVHGLNSSLVAGIGAALLRPRAGLIAGVVFSAFPGSAEAVVWTAGIFDLFATHFILLAVTASLRRPIGRREAWFLIPVCVAAFLSKETAIVLPVLLIPFAAASLQGWQDAKQRALAVGVTVVLAAGYLVTRMFFSATVSGHFQNIPSDRREFKDLIVRPFAAVAVPLRTDAGVGVEAYVVGLIILVLLGIALVQLSWTRANAGHGNPPRAGGAVLTFAVAWILVSSLPLLGQFYVAPTLEGSRYLYLPSVGFALVIAAAFVGTQFDTQERVALAALVSLLAIYAFQLGTERSIWMEAARRRDAVLAEASRIISATPCRTLTVHDAPDNVRGAFVFRQGLTEALEQLEMNPNGHACDVRWTGSLLVPVQPRTP